MATAEGADAPASWHEWSQRMMPRTVLGMAVLILAFAIGAAFSGVVFYSYYEFRKDQTEEFVGTFDRRFDAAMRTIDAETENAKAEINKELEPLRQLQAEGGTLQNLLEQAEPSVWFVRTLDEAGQPSVGSAFVVASDSEQSLLLTSHAVVRAATRSPGPAVVLRKGDNEIRATVWTWQEDRDLALLVIDRGGLPALSFAPSNPPLGIGVRVFAVSGLGGANGSITQGFVSDVSENAIQHDSPVGTAFRGGPIIDSEGRLLAVASRAYAPLGFTSEGVYFGVPIRAACANVLRCPDDQVEGAGPRR